MTVKISVRNVGINFGVVGVVKRGRKVLATTPVYPRGFQASAIEGAESLAIRNGWL